MKLKDGFMTHTTGGEQIMVSAGGQRFNGLVRSNATAAFIVEQLKTDTTPEKIVDALEAEYDAPRATLERDVDRILDILRSIPALDE